jgi:hypothetical protein
VNQPIITKLSVEIVAPAPRSSACLERANMAAACGDRAEHVGTTDAFGTLLSCHIAVANLTVLPLPPTISLTRWCEAAGSRVSGRHHGEGEIAGYAERIETARLIRHRDGVIDHLDELDSWITGRIGFSTELAYVIQPPAEQLARRDDAADRVVASVNSSR